MYAKVPVTLKKAQFHKLKSGKPIQLAAHQIGGPQKHHLMLHPVTAKKVALAIRKGAGVRVQMSPHEFETTAQGNGFLDFFKDLGNNIKKGVDWVKSNVIDSPFYQQNVRPLVRDAINSGVAALAPTIGPKGVALANASVGALSNSTSAFGLKGKRAPRKAVASLASEPKKRGPRFKLQSDQAVMLGPSHPAMHPIADALPDIGSIDLNAVRVARQPKALHHRKKRGLGGLSQGGSFRPS